MFGATPFFSKPVNKRMFGVFAGLALAGQANAHLFLQYPAAPIEGPIKSPLLPDGSDFPCHGAKLPSSGGMKMAAGSSQLLQFDDGDGANTAVHGGGSCQMSVLYDIDKAADPKAWSVIHSFEGGCPTNSAGNLDGQYTGPQGSYSGAIQCSDPKANGVDCLNSYNFTIPKGLKEGHALLAWTWFNTIGNREMYMNCVNAQIEGGDGSEMGTLPSLFVANLQGAGMPQCATGESESYKFPFPGKYTTSNTKGSKYKLSPPTGGSCAKDGAPAGGAAAGGSGSGSGGAGSSAAPSANPPKAPAAGAGDGSKTLTTIQTQTGGSGAAASSAPAPAISSAPASAPAISSAPAAAPSSAAPAPSAPAASGSSGSCAAGGQPCSGDGSVVCIGDNMFGICNQGCAVPQPLAAGTKCSGGAIQKRDHVRRHLSHARDFA